MIRRGALRLFAALAIAASGCGPGVAEGTVVEIEQDTRELSGLDTDTGAAKDSDTDTGPGAPMDTDTASDLETATESQIDAGIDTGEECPDDIFDDSTVFVADEILADSRIVDMSSECLLLTAQENGETRTVVVFTDPWYTGKIAVAVEMVSPMTPVALTCHPDRSEAVVLFHADTGSALYQVDGYSEEFTLLTGGEAFGGVSLTGVNRFMRTTNGGVDRICAFGQGIFCADYSSGFTEWEMEVAHTTGQHFNDMDLLPLGDGWSLIAVGTGGRILVEIAGTWQTVDSGTEEDLLTTSTAGSTFTAAGRNGVFVHGTVDHTAQYTFFDEDVVSLYWWSDRFFKGATAEGTVFEGQVQGGELTICLTSVEPTEVVLSSILLHCGDTENYLIMTESLVLGTYDCSAVVTV